MSSFTFAKASEEEEEDVKDDTNKQRHRDAIDTCI